MTDRVKLFACPEGGWRSLDALEVTPSEQNIPSGHVLHISPTLIRMSGRGYCLDVRPSFVRLGSTRVLRSYNNGAFRSEYRRQLRWWWTVTNTLIEKHWRKLGRRTAARNARYIRMHADHVLMNELTGYYGKRRRGHSFMQRVIWPMWVGGSVRINMPCGSRITKRVAKVEAKDVAQAVKMTLRRFGLCVDDMSEDDAAATVWHYTNGMCYKLFLMLRQVYPDAEPWYDHVVGHVYTRIGEHWYDIRGEHRNRTDLRPLDHRSGHKPHRWKGVSSIGPNGKPPHVPCIYI